MLNWKSLKIASTSCRCLWDPRILQEPSGCRRGHGDSGANIRGRGSACRTAVCSATAHWGDCSLGSDESVTQPVNFGPVGAEGLARFKTNASAPNSTASCDPAATKCRKLGPLQLSP